MMTEVIYVLCSVSLSCTDYVLLTWGKQPRVQKQLTLVLSMT